MAAMKITMKATPAITGHLRLDLLITSGSGKEVAHFAEFFVALLDGLIGGKAGQLAEGAEEFFPEQVGCRVGILVCAAGGFGDDAVDQAQL